MASKIDKRLVSQGREKSQIGKTNVLCSEKIFLLRTIPIKSPKQIAKSLLLGQTKGNIAI